MEEYWFDVKGYLRGEGIGECLYLMSDRKPNEVSEYSRIRKNFSKMIERLKLRLGK